MIKTRTKVVGAVVACAIVCAGALSLGSAFAEERPSNTSTPPAADTNWIQEEDTVKPLTSEGSQPESFPVPREQSEGDLVSAVLTVAAKVVPADAKQVFATSYPDLKAATTGFTSGDFEYLVSIQQLAEPLSLGAITATKPDDVKLVDLDTGTQRVEVRGPQNSYAQVVLVNQNGISITVTVSQQVGDGKSAPLPEITEWATQALDVADVDVLIQEVTR